MNVRVYEAGDERTSFSLVHDGFSDGPDLRADVDNTIASAKDVVDAQVFRRVYVRILDQ